MRFKHTSILVLSLFILNCSNKQKNVNHNVATKMELKVFSNYGSEEKIISDSTSIEQIKEIMSNLNWNDFHQVVLSSNNRNWIEVGGNLNGLSSMYEENGKQFIINKPPSSIDHMTEILVSYFYGDGKYKKENSFE